VLTLEFSQAISGLAASDITLSGVSGVTKGTFSGSNPYYLHISGFTSNGSLSVTIGNKAGYAISGSPQSVYIYYYDNIIYPSNLASYLASLSDGFLYFITLKVTSASEFSIIRSALQGAPNKYVDLDISGSTITTIPENAFESCYNIVSVTMPNSITSIGKSAFASCFNLSKITIPSGVNSIGENAFEFCSSLSSVTIPSSVTSIANFVFYGCWNLTSVTIPSSVTSIGERAFSSCSSLSSVTIPSSVRSIGDYAFSSCTSLSSVTIPNNVSKIATSSFSYCTSLSSVTIGSGVTSIEGSAFSGCTSLPRITIPSSVNSIEYEAFHGCDALNSVTFQGTIPSSNWYNALSPVINPSFPGNLRAVFYSTNPSMGTAGTYTRASGSTTWMRQ
jgi:hypothetical protein